MKVETYEVEEIKSSEAATMAADSEAIELCEKLGLSGQRALTNTTTETRCPYRRISAEEVAVFRNCFPNTSKLEDYRDGIIPLRVLQVVAYAKELEFFTRFDVWHPAAGQKDPVLIGVHTYRPEGRSWDTTEEYLLARWGESLEPFEQLKEKARKLITSRWRSKLEKVKREVEIAIPALESMADEMLEGGTTKGEPYFSW